MTSQRFYCDSIELDELRYAYHQKHPGKRATPRRLGAFAFWSGKLIYDYGGHSKRWIELFKAAYLAAKCM